LPLKKKQRVANPEKSHRITSTSVYTGNSKSQKQKNILKRKGQAELISHINELFNNRKIRKVFLKLRLPLALVFFVLFLPHTRQAWFFPGLIVSILGELLQVWCFSTIKTHKKLTVIGPYMFVRNPMYIGRFFLIFGILMMAANPWLLLIYTALYWFYMTNRVKREEKLLAELFGEDYRNYQNEVRPYLPTFSKWRPELLWSFNRESFSKNNALVNMATVAVVYFVLYYFTFARPL
jgi:protein-S-isoprenylcysteine O-methyltransferase Ste14